MMPDQISSPTQGWMPEQGHATIFLLLGTSLDVVADGHTSFIHFALRLT